jgi:ribosome-binding factor A
MSRRTERIADLLRAELSLLLLREVHDPRISLTSVVSVSVSPDLRHAQVRVSVLGDDQHRADSLAALHHARGFLRTQIAQRLRLRVAPDLAFELDRGAEHSQRISDLLEGRHADDGT